MIIDSSNVPETTGSNYPEKFKSLVAGRFKKRLGNIANLKNFGVNLVKLKPGSRSALRHWHTKQDEFIYILEGEATLVTNAGKQILKSGMAAGFPAGEADGHHLLNLSNTDVVYLEIGDRLCRCAERNRTSQDTVDYPDDDLIAVDDAGTWRFTHKDGSFYNA
jgi:uncharacterized cupin superfamily protein